MQIHQGPECWQANLEFCSLAPVIHILPKRKIGSPSPNSLISLKHQVCFFSKHKSCYFVDLSIPLRLSCIFQVDITYSTRLTPFSNSSILAVLLYSYIWFTPGRLQGTFSLSSRSKLTVFQVMFFCLHLFKLAQITGFLSGFFSFPWHVFHSPEKVAWSRGKSGLWSQVNTDSDFLSKHIF